MASTATSIWEWRSTALDYESWRWVRYVPEMRGVWYMMHDCMMHDGPGLLPEMHDLWWPAAGRPHRLQAAAGAQQQAAVSRMWEQISEGFHVKCPQEVAHLHLEVHQLWNGGTGRPTFRGVGFRMSLEDISIFVLIHLQHFQIQQRGYSRFSADESQSEGQPCQ